MNDMHDIIVNRVALSVFYLKKTAFGWDQGACCDKDAPLFFRGSSIWGA